ncbi:YqjF family protein [Streptomyces sp. 7N604]|uniref:YqjF family protein n=1 Tax=Streptomyces sp. 7N604 TaxID=3457415 RepID=UPI003FD1648D
MEHRERDAGPGPAPLTATAPHTIRRPILTQWWTDVTFLHWPADPDAVAPLLPRGIRPDVLDGTTYVGLVPFRMERVSIGRRPALPYLGTFPETNVRLYSVDGQGRRGVVFRSLDAARLLPVLSGRAGFRLPYLWSSMSITRDGSRLTYTGRRLPPERPRKYRISVEIGGKLERPGELESFLTARWGLHVDWYGRTLHLPNAHPAWPLHTARVHHLEEDLIRAAGLAAPQGPPCSVLYSPGVPVVFGTPATAQPSGPAAASTASLSSASSPS